MATLTCHTCQEELDTDKFYKRINNRSGYSSNCKECTRTNQKAYRKKMRLRDVVKLPDEKHCSVCKRSLPVSRFYSNKSNLDGLMGQCKSCMKPLRKTHKVQGKKQEVMRTKVI